MTKSSKTQSQGGFGRLSGVALPSNANLDSEASNELFEEVAAFLEFEAHYSREKAEELARVRVYSAPELPYAVIVEGNRQLSSKKLELGLECIPDYVLSESWIGVDRWNNYYVPLFNSYGKCISYDRRSDMSVKEYFHSQITAKSEEIEAEFHRRSSEMEADS